MICDECLKELVTGLPEGAKKILKLLHKHGELNKTEIESGAVISYHMSQKLLAILEGAKLVKHRARSRAKIYSLSENGKRVLKLYRESGKDA